MQNVTAASILGLFDANAQSSPIGARPIHFDYAANLDKDDIYTFLADDKEMRWKAPAVDNLIRQGFELSLITPKPVGIIEKFPNDMPGPLAGAPLRLFWAVQNRCMILQGGGTIPGHRTTPLNLPLYNSWQVTIQISVVLYVKRPKNDPARKAMEKAFDSFQYPRDGDPLDYLKKEWGTITSVDPKITLEEFSCENTFTINKVPNSFDSHRDMAQAMMGLFDGSTKATIHPTGDPTDEPIRSFFVRRDIKFACLEGPPQYVGRISEPPHDPTHEVTLKPGETPDKVIKDIADNDLPPNPDKCGEMKEKDWPILTLLVWPEFKIDWRDFSFNIGCGVRIVLTLPVLQTQISGLDLWAYTHFPSNAGTYAENVIKTCAIAAALTGAVLGIATSNFVAALEAFNAAFQLCIVDHLTSTVDCMMPGLGLMKAVKNPWQDVKIG
jgi:hypothetical protein